MKKKIVQFCILIMFLVFNFASCKTEHDINFDNQPTEDVVPDSETAIKIAEAIWESRYSRSIHNYKPFNAKLVGDSIWLVEGSLSIEKVGGVPYVEIRKSDCTVLKVEFFE